VAVEYHNLRNVTAREIVSALLRDGFLLRRQRGSHQRYQHPDGRRVTVTFHGSSDTFPIGTLREMIDEQAHWKEEDLRRLRLIR
jgi:predicted RNA binding protein YcfA (HicA-like mRNA interferase family)